MKSKREIGSIISSKVDFDSSTTESFTYRQNYLLGHSFTFGNHGKALATLYFIRCAFVIWDEIKLCNIVGAKLLFSSTTSLFLLNEDEINNACVASTMLYSITPALVISF